MPKTFFNFEDGDHKQLAELLVEISESIEALVIMQNQGSTDVVSAVRDLKETIKDNTLAVQVMEKLVDKTMERMVQNLEFTRQDEQKRQEHDRQLELLKHKQKGRLIREIVLSILGAGGLIYVIIDSIVKRGS